MDEIVNIIKKSNKQQAQQKLFTVINFCLSEEFSELITLTHTPQHKNSSLYYSSINDKTNRKQLFLICLFFSGMSSEINRVKLRGRKYV